MFGLCFVVELLKPPYWSSYSKPRLWLHTVVSSKYFDLGIAAVIGVNVVTMAIEHYNMPKVICDFILHFQISRCEYQSRAIIGVGPTGDYLHSRIARFYSVLLLISKSSVIAAVLTLFR